MNNIVSLRLRYFPFSGRAGSIRDALKMGSIAFDDVHLSFDEYKELNASNALPFGALPVLDIETTTEKVSIAQSNAILCFVGRRSGLYPENDELVALKIDEALGIGEDLYALLWPSLHEENIERKMEMRSVLAEKALPRWLGFFERLLVANGSTGFVDGDDLTVADLKIYWICQFLVSGDIDGISTSLLDDFSTISSWFKNIAIVRKERLDSAE